MKAITRINFYLATEDMPCVTKHRDNTVSLHSGFYDTDCPDFAITFRIEQIPAIVELLEALREIEASQISTPIEVITQVAA